MEDFKKELALLLETYQVALVARVHHYGDNKTTGMVVFQDYTGTVESNTRRSHVTAHDLDYTLQQAPLGKKVEGLGE